MTTVKKGLISNRKQLKIARDAIKAIPPEQRNELRMGGLGPGDSYIVMWRALNLYRRRLTKVAEGSQPWEYLMVRIIDCCRR